MCVYRLTGHMSIHNLILHITFYLVLHFKSAISSLFDLLTDDSIGSSGWERGGGDKKHEIYVATFGGHLFYDLFLQGLGGGHGPFAPPDPLLDDSHILGHRNAAAVKFLTKLWITMEPPD